MCLLGLLKTGDDALKLVSRGCAARDVLITRIQIKNGFFSDLGITAWVDFDAIMYHVRRCPV